MSNMKTLGNKTLLVDTENWAARHQDMLSKIKTFSEHKQKTASFKEFIADERARQIAIELERLSRKNVKSKRGVWATEKMSLNTKSFEEAYEMSDRVYFHLMNMFAPLLEQQGRPFVVALSVSHEHDNYYVYAKGNRIRAKEVSQ